MIAIETGNLEIALATLFARMLSVPMRTGRAVYLTPKAAHARLDILRNAAKAAFDRKVKSKELNDHYKEALAKVTDIISRAGKANDKRNRIVHDSWGYNDDDNEVSRLMIDGNPDGQSVSVPLSELENDLKSLRIVIQDAASLARHFHKNPPLIADLRNSATNSG